MNIYADPTYVGSISFKGMNAHCIGAATDEEYTVYLSMVGYRTANKALWAALMEKRNALQIGKSMTFRRLDGPYLHDEKPIPSISMAHMIILHHQASVMHNEPDKDFYLLTDNPFSARHYQRFYTMLNRAVSLPMLPEWGEFMFDWGLQNEFIKPLKGKGIQCFTVNADLPAWELCIQCGIEKGKIQ